MKNYPHSRCVLALALASSLGCGVAFSPRADATPPGDEHWDTRFGWPGVKEWVYALASSGNSIYSSGLNPGEDGTHVNIRVWDGTKWSVVGVALRFNISI